MKIDNFYFVVDNIEESIAFYTELLGEKPTNITDDRWADWKNENNQIYFGIISKEATGSKQIKGNAKAIILGMEVETWKTCATIASAT